MQLKEYWGKKVFLESKNGKIFRGKVSDYVYPEDNENGKESIIIDSVGYEFPYEFYENDIKKIEIIN
ncbi:hypothetical protein [Ignavigranum ruoffiae]|uniref:hypothetical protein n=1 Tax=Ignavigranum ruoffiae TaxID=89093 RepID=UPI0023576495|nr:hypothetical protein [Ignavigranum ruoffiae]